MTPIIGLLVAVIVGFLATTRRGVLIGVIAPMLASTAAQSWYLGTGRGHNPPATTTDSPAYWVVQLIIVALMSGVALGIYVIRARRAALTSHGQAGPMVVVGTVAALAGTLAVMFATDRPGHPATGNGNLPVTGIIGISIAILALAAFALLWLRGRSARTEA
jgi:hypothetical protein